MSYSIHYNGKTIKDARGGLVKHMFRKEKTAKAAAEATDSHIDVTQTHHNANFFLTGVTHDSITQIIKDELKGVDEARLKKGLKKFRSDANIFSVATIQLSDESLKLLGMLEDEEEDGKKWLPMDKQPREVKERVSNVYTRIVKSVHAQRGIYGKILGGSLHLDESSPHVDLIVLNIDRNEPELKTRDFLNGPKGTPRGQKLREMQDHLLDKSDFTKVEIEKFDLKRGLTGKGRKDRLMALKKYDNELDDREKALIEREKALDEKEARIDLEVQDKANNAFRALSYEKVKEAVIEYFSRISVGKKKELARDVEKGHHNGVDKETKLILSQFDIDEIERSIREEAMKSSSSRNKYKGKDGLSF